MTLDSALYVGTIRHRRFVERDHRFQYPLFMLYVDLDELDVVFRGSWLWSSRRPALAWLRRADYAGDASRSWSDSVRDLVEAKTGKRPSGPVRLLTNPRTLGLRMNPVSFYYCFDTQGILETVVAEITNTPWDERHHYVVHREGARVSLRSRSGSQRVGARSTNPPLWEAWFDKDLHVSPFLPMHMNYRWALAPPGDRLVFHMENHRDGEKALDATLSLRRQEISPSSLRRILLRHPLLTLRILLWIYLHAALLKLKGVTFYPHPRTLEEPRDELAGR